MLKIRKDQIETLREAILANFQDEMVVHLAARAIEKLPAEHWQRLVVAGMVKASGYGLRTRPEVTEFLELLADYGLDFDEQSWVRNLLEFRVVGIGQRLQLIKEELATSERPKASPPDRIS